MSLTGSPCKHTMPFESSQLDYSSPKNSELIRPMLPLDKSLVTFLGQALNVLVAKIVNHVSTEQARNASHQTLLDRENTDVINETP